MALGLGIVIGLLIIFLLVLIGPFKVKIIERNLEVFLFFCGILALTISGFAVIEGTETGWRWDIIYEALTAPLKIADIYGVPIGIVQIVLIVGLIIYKWHEPINRAIMKMTKTLSPKIMAFFLIVALGLISSVISAILAAIILVVMVNAMPLPRSSKIELTVIACFSIGLGAALTPLGEPLSTIAIAKLSGEPYHASFDYLIRLLGIYIVPGIIAFGIVGMLLIRRAKISETDIKAEELKETLKDVFMRAVKVYVFIMALVFLGEGFKPLIIEYFRRVPSEGLYWINMTSAILDNATLTAAEIGPILTEVQIKSALMGMLIAGGMLIPGNIPNIISANKMNITSKEWAKIGVPVGIVTMVVYFIILFVPKYLGFG